MTSNFRVLSHATVEEFGDNNVPCITWTDGSNEFTTYLHNDKLACYLGNGLVHISAEVIAWLRSAFRNLFKEDEPAPRFVIDDWHMLEYNDEMVPSIDWYRGDRQYRTFLHSDGKLSTHKRSRRCGVMRPGTVDDEVLAEDVACLRASFDKLFGKRCQPVPAPSAPALPKLQCRVLLFDRYINVEDVENLPQLQQLYKAIDNIFGTSNLGTQLKSAAVVRLSEYLQDLPHKWAVID